MTVSNAIKLTPPALPETGKIVVPGRNPKAGNANLGAEDFMKLLTTQLTAQNPMEPMKDTEFIAQMANFSSLEQMRTLSNSFTSFAGSQAMSTAPLYLDRQVTVTDPASPTGTTTGKVSAIVLKDNARALLINGKTYALNLVTQIG